MSAQTACAPTRHQSIHLALRRRSDRALPRPEFSSALRRTSHASDREVVSLADQGSWFGYRPPVAWRSQRHRNRHHRAAPQPPLLDKATPSRQRYIVSSRLARACNVIALLEIRLEWMSCRLGALMLIRGGRVRFLSGSALVSLCWLCGLAPAHPPPPKPPEPAPPPPPP